MAAKVAVIGSLHGSFSNIIPKLHTLYSKTKFDLAILVGNVFADPSNPSLDSEKDLLSLLYGTIAFPFPTYFSLGTFPLPEKVIERLEENGTGELAENLYFLGKRTTTKTADGIRIVSLGGSLDPKIVAGLSDKEDKYLPFHTEGDAKSLSGVVGPDLLITSTWPAGIRTNSALKPSEIADPPSETGVAQLCALTKPTYHFSSSDDVFFEREPFLHPPTEPIQSAKHITRFISLASPTSSTKAKWLYAFNLHHSSAPPTTTPNGTTETPFSVKTKRDRELMFGRFSTAGNGPERKSKRQKRDREKVSGPQECFFCLSNESLATHMLVSIGEESYLATAKGPLSTSESSPLDCPSHILIIPHAHRPTLPSIADASERKKTYDEMEQYRTALHSMLKTKAKGFGSVTWEVSRAEGVHVHWQWMPVPVELIDKGLVEAGYQVEAENLEYPPFERRCIGDGGDEGGDFFRVRIWRPEASEELAKNAGESGASDEAGKNGDGNGEGGKGGSETELVLALTGEHKFDIQFGRRVLAKLLGLESRLRWQDCAQDESEETADAEKFKEEFAAWDFANE